MQQPQQDVPAYPWGATMGTEAVGVPRHVTRCMDNWGACWGVGMQGRGILQNAVASHFPQSECSCITKAQVHRTRGSKHPSLPRSYSSPYLIFSQKNIKELLTSSGCCYAREFQILTKSLWPRPVWPSPELSGKNRLWMPFQGDVEGPLDTNRNYRCMHLKIAWDKAAKTIYCFCLHVKGMEWEACNIWCMWCLPQRSQDLLPKLWPRQQRDILGTNYKGSCGWAI